MRRESHPLLRGGRRGGKYKHAFSSAEMESLANICEALLPPLQLESLDTMENNPTCKAVQFFWKSSGSQFSVPDEVPHLMYATLACLFQCLTLSIYLFIVFLQFRCPNQNIRHRKIVINYSTALYISLWDNEGVFCKMKLLGFKNTFLLVYLIRKSRF